MFILDHLVVGPFQMNTYLLGCSETSQCAVIDAGGPGMPALASSHGLKITKILQTHAHVDHVAGLPELKSETHAPIYLHPDDNILMENAPAQGQFLGFPVGAMPPCDHFLEDGALVEVGNLRAKVIHLPGHTPGSIAYHFEEFDLLFTGDVLFAGSIGRTDLPGGDMAAMKRSLSRLIQLPDQTRVFSGHGPETTIGVEKRRNPYLNGAFL